MQVTLSDEAKTDGRDAVDWYIEEGLFSVAGGFVDKLEHSLHLLSQFPELGRQGPFGARTLPLHVYPYSLVYRIQSVAIRVIAIAHHSRRPRYWAGRR